MAVMLALRVVAMLQPEPQGALVATGAPCKSSAAERYRQEAFHLPVVQVVSGAPAPLVYPALAADSAAAAEPAELAVMVFLVSLALLEAMAVMVVQAAPAVSVVWAAVVALVGPAVQAVWAALAAALRLQR